MVSANQLQRQEEGAVIGHPESHAHFHGQGVESTAPKPWGLVVGIGARPWREIRVMFLAEVSC